MIRDVINVHMEELSNNWQEEQEKAEDDAEKYVIVFIGENILFLNSYNHLSFSISKGISSTLVFIRALIVSLHCLGLLHQSYKTCYKNCVSLPSYMTCKITHTYYLFRYCIIGLMQNINFRLVHTEDQ